MLYDIVTALQNAQGSNNKQAILLAHKENNLFRKYMKAVYDPAINYYQKKLPEVVAGSLATVDEEFLKYIHSTFAERKVVGNTAKALMKVVSANLDVQGQKLFALIINRSIGASVGDSMVLKTWPNLYFQPPYMRCSLMDDKAKARFSELDSFILQKKADGSFAYVVKREDGTSAVITRQGGQYPQEFAQMLTEGVPNGWVMVGELEVVDKSGALLDRKTGNGILTSCLKDGEGLSDGECVRLQAWDCLTEEEFLQGKSNSTYSDRWAQLIEHLQAYNPKHIQAIETHFVSGLTQAYEIYAEILSQGYEGCVAKNPDSLWKDGTSKDMVKMKLKVEVELRCVGMYEGEGKAKGKMGGINLESEDGELITNCGTGFTDTQRKDYWEFPALIRGKVCTISANDIIQSRDSRKKPALSLPAFEEVRHDKHVADTLESIINQINAAKGIV